MNYINFIIVLMIKLQLINDTPMLNWLLQKVNPPQVNYLQTVARPSLTDLPDIDEKEQDSDNTLLKVAKLIMVTANNNNKFYEMKEQADGTFTVNYGRVGSRGTVASYPIRLWDSKLREKIRKGYKDQTYLFAQESGIQEQLSITDNQVQKLVESLMRYARQSIYTNYAVSADQVTRQQVEEAQALLDTLVEMISPTMNIKAFNISLLALYQVIPRKMNNVNDYLVKKEKDGNLNIEKTEKLIAEEQSVLDVMRGQVEVNEKQKQPKTEPMTLLEAMGLQIEAEKDSKAIQTIKQMMGKEAHLFRQAYKVVNIRTQKAFDGFLANAKNKTVKLFWHGSRNENWLSILKTGLVLRPANAVITGKMFGYGLYFADKFRKSLNYTSLSGSYWAGGTQKRAFISLYDVHTGNQMKVLRHKSWCYDLTETKLKARRPDCDSLFAKGGADLINNEYIIYNQAQCTIRYIVEVQR